MDTYFHGAGLQGYVFGEGTASATRNEDQVGRRVSQGGPDSLFPNANGEAMTHAGRLASVALPRLEKGAIQHEMIVAYLYQQQRQRFWISDDLTSEEGAFMRETWSDFITAPAPLSESCLADALVDLNAEVGVFGGGRVVALECLLILDRSSSP